MPSALTNRTAALATARPSRPSEPGLHPARLDASDLRGQGPADLDELASWAARAGAWTLRYLAGVLGRGKGRIALALARTGFKIPPSMGGVYAVSGTGEVHDSTLADWLPVTGSRGDLSAAYVEQYEGCDPSSPHGLSAHVVAPGRSLHVGRTSLRALDDAGVTPGHSVRKSRGIRMFALTT